ncbi:TetR/AcrR family transcriptional regulator [Vibrio sp. RE86]|uniref:TetR family transcriptional regulator n=1 Tax=Vibrio sp. RE86 TaxID=2607605 RepID=UPI001493D60B|nr:TetR family transcriptional regulator [Vibrio sp. RE86]NOH79602.1 TetR/AcrR family transcriptional regulator [Vibrio sp. RE86]
MPKRSKEDTLMTINLILDTVTRQLLENGYDAMSYTTLSKETGVSRTGISHHFPKKTDFLDALQGRLLKQFSDHIDFKNDLEKFESSWDLALEKKNFRAILCLILSQISKGEREQMFARTFIVHLHQTATAIFGDDAKHIVDGLIGRSFIKLL